MSLAKKYGIPENVVRQLYNDGWLVAKANPHQYIYDYYLKSLAAGKDKTEAIYEAAELARVSERTVYNVIKEFE